MKKFLSHLTPNPLVPKARNQKSECPPSNLDNTQSNLGLREIYSSPNPTVTIIAIHGHGGHVTEDWTDSDTSCFWLRDLLPDIFMPETHIRVLGLGYSKEDEDTIGAEGIASFAVGEVNRSAGNGDGDLVWLAHSFGGPLLKGLLSSYQGLLDRTRAVLFFGVPRHNSSWKNMAFATAGEDGVSGEIEKLQREVKWLGETESKFAELSGEGRFKVWWFLESSGGIEDENRAESGREDVIHLSRVHNDMLMFKGSEDGDWKKVERVLVAVAGSLRQGSQVKET